MYAPKNIPRPCKCEKWTYPLTLVVAEDGTLQYSPYRMLAQQNRFEYRYDDRGNWVEKRVLIRPEGKADFQASNITRRVITYHAFP
jgi:hypothetical protein